MQSMDQLSADETWDQLYPTLYPTVVVVWMSLEQEIVSCSFEVCYSPPTAGLHQLRVQVGGTDILDEPLTVEVMPRKAGQTFNSFSMPAGVAITNNGQLIVAEWGKDSITITSRTTARRSAASENVAREECS